MTHTTNDLPKCDRHGCVNDAAWSYRVNTLNGVETWLSCQQHVADLRAVNGPNIMAVEKVTR